MMLGIVYSLYNVSHMEIPAVQQVFGECISRYIPVELTLISYYFVVQSNRKME